ncbi:VanZ family protein [Bacillus luteolus]|uniref:VanZ family protein n=1 Tax=Litchfieldia luteola TaxID=682179 RepID=A0ABR9QFM1_9BACI|nr:VanZ family protein [Cytobacillus luteolus]
MMYFSIKIAPFVYMGLIWILSSLPHDAVIDTPYSWDRAFKESLHLIAFGILYLLFVLSFAVDGKLTHKTSKIAAAIAISYGFIDELHQYFVPYRSATVIDIVKDTIGVLVAYYLIRRFYLTKKGA